MARQWLCGRFNQIRAKGLGTFKLDFKMDSAEFSKSLREHISTLKVKSRHYAVRQTKSQRDHPSLFECRSDEDLLLLVDGLLARYSLYFLQEPVWERIQADTLGICLGGDRDKLTISLQWESSAKDRSGNVGLIWIMKSPKHFIVSIDRVSELKFMQERYAQLLELPAPGNFSLSLVESLGRPLRYADVWEDSDA
jgi:hypothetical protein